MKRRRAFALTLSVLLLAGVLPAQPPLLAARADVPAPAVETVPPEEGDVLEVVKTDDETAGDGLTNTTPAPTDTAQPAAGQTEEPEEPDETPGPSNEPAQTSEETPGPSNEPAQTPEETPAPSNEPAQTPEETPAPSNEPAQTPEETPAPPGEPAQTPEETPGPSNDPAQTPEETPAPPNGPVQTPEEPAIPTDQPDAPSEEPALPNAGEDEYPEATPQLPSTLLEPRTDNPIVFDKSAVEATYYLRADTSFWIVDRIILVHDVSSYGTPVWTISDISGGSLSYLGVQKRNKWYCEVELYGIVASGDTTATVTCTAGEYSASIPVTIHVLDQAVPSAVDAPSVISGTVGVPIHVPRPALSPAGVQPDADHFYFEIWESVAFGEHATVSGYSFTGYDVTFDAPGYYVAYLSMYYANIDLYRSVMFSIADASGDIPGNPIRFYHDTIDKTWCYAGDRAGQVVDWVYLVEDISALGEPVWTLEDIQGTSVGGLRIAFSDVAHCDLEFTEILSAGDTEATLTCAVGGYSASIPIAIHILGGTAPTSLDTPSYYTGLVGESFEVAKPGMLPAGTDFGPDDFFFDLNGDDAFWNHGAMEGRPDGGYSVSFDEPGFYGATIRMSYLNIVLEKSVTFVVGDDGGVPFAATAILGVEAVSATALKIAWQAVDAADGYELRRATDPAGAYARVYEGAATSYTNTGLSGGTIYYYKAVAYKEVGGVRYCGPESLPRAGRPAAGPVIQSAEAVNGKAIAVAWTSSPGAVGYELWRGLSSAGRYTLSKALAGTSYTNTYLTVGTLYYYKVRAYAVLGGEKLYGAFGPVVSAIPLPKPATPQAVSAGKNAVRVTWAALAGVTAYEVWRSASPSGPYVRVYKGQSLFFIDKALRPGGYYYKIRGYRPVGTKMHYSPMSGYRSIKVK